MYKRSNEFIRVDSSPDRYDRKRRLVYKDGSGLGDDGRRYWRLGMVETEPSRAHHGYDHVEFESEGFQLFNNPIFPKIRTSKNRNFGKNNIQVHIASVYQIFYSEKNPLALGTVWTKGEENIDVHIFDNKEDYQNQFDDL